MSTTPSKIATIMLAGCRPGDPDIMVGMPAGELFEWGWLAAELADWLDHAAEATQRDHAHFFDHLRSTHNTAYVLAHIADRIGMLLDGEQGQP